MLLKFVFQPSSCASRLQGVGCLGIVPSSIASLSSWSLLSTIHLSLCSGGCLTPVATTKTIGLAEPFLFHQENFFFPSFAPTHLSVDHHAHACAPSRNVSTNVRATHRYKHGAGPYSLALCHNFFKRAFCRNGVVFFSSFFLF